MSLNIKGLSPEEAELYRQFLSARESGNNPAAVNQLGYTGLYQMGTAALIDAGYVKQGTYVDKHNTALNNPANWTIPGGKEAFISNPSYQDDAFQKYTNANHRYLVNGGKITPDMPSVEVAGRLAAAHLGGHAAVKTDGFSSKPDANGTVPVSYYTEAKYALNTGDPSIGGKYAVDKGRKPTAPVDSTVKGGSADAASSAASTQPPTPYKPKGFTGVTTGPVELSLSSPDGHVYDEPQNYPLPNPLSQFNSFSPVLTLSCLSDYHVNNPDFTYKVGDLGQIICRSGGGFPDNRVETYHGKFEYYIDSAEVGLLMAMNRKTEATNATTIKFTVIEPYSMGMFLQSLQIASKMTKPVDYQGKVNYLQDIAFLLTIEFYGHFPDGSTGIVPNTTRHIPIKISNAEMLVTSAGCTYEVTGIAWNEIALSDSNSLFDSDIAISGSTVGELLQSGPRSLQYVINSFNAERANKGNGAPLPDEVVILFPKFMNSDVTGNQADSEGSATVDPNVPKQAQPVTTKLTLTRSANQNLIQSEEDINVIGKSSMGFTANHSGNPGKVGDVEVVDVDTGLVDRSKIYIDPTNRELTFTQNTSITNAITQVILLSEYGKAIAKDRKNAADKMYDWFRIETQVFSLPGNDDNLRINGRNPRLLVYKVVPYKVHPMRYTSSNTTPPGYENLRKNAAKEYNYIYTGKNTDVLDFEIKLNHAFYSAVLADSGNLGYETGNQSQTGAGGSTGAELAPAVGDGKVTQNDQPTTTGTVTGTASDNRGGSAAKDHSYAVAKQFHQAMINSDVDLVAGKLTILGDPYFIADSGLGNWSNAHTGTFNVTETGAMNYQNGEVDLVLNFRTPIDINQSTGYYDFGDTQIVEQFSGLYQVTVVDTFFDRGVFKQELSLIRRRQQEKQDAAQAENTVNQSAPTQDRDQPAMIDPTVASNKEKNKAYANGNDASALMQPITNGKTFNTRNIQ